jgi:hypothetical protein
VSNEDTSVERIGEFLRRVGAITNDHVEQILAVQREHPERKFGEIAVELGFISEDLIDRFLSSHKAG